VNVQNGEEVAVKLVWHDSSVRYPYFGEQYCVVGVDSSWSN